MAEHNEVAGKPPVNLSGQLTSAISSGIAHDFLIGGLPFLLKPSEEDPYVRDLKEDRVDQFDSSGEAGENSFGYWWLRSQSSFHGGGGQLFLDSSSSPASRVRFESSVRLDVRTPGELKIVPEPFRTVIAKNQVEQVTWAGVQKLVSASTGSDAVTTWNIPSFTGQTLISLSEVGQLPIAMTSDGVNVFVAINGKIKRINPDATVTHTHNIAYTGTVAMGFAKQRLIVTDGPRVFELDPNPATPPVTVNMATPHYKNPSTQYKYTSIADGPNGIYVAGASGQRSDLSLMTVSENAGSLVMGPPVVQLAMPPGEVINNVMFYVNSFFGLATSAGFRVGSFTPYGQVQMGPPSIEGVACYSITAAREQFIVGALKTLWYVDLSNPVDESGRYAHSLFDDALGDSSLDYVNDVTVHPGTKKDHIYATMAEGRMLWMDDAAVYPHDTPGSLTTSWARFGTIEPKQLHYVRIDGTFPLAGVDNPVCTVRVENDKGGFKEFNIKGGTSQTSFEFSTRELAPAQSFRLVLTLRKSVGQASSTARIRGFQMKALPSPKIFGEHILPLLCHDIESPVNGPEAGYPGYAADRLRALEEMAEKSLRITVVDRIMNESYQAVVRRVQYRQGLAPTRQGGTGGVVSVILRKV